MDGGLCVAGDVSFDLVDGVYSRVSTGRAGRLAAEAGVGLPVGVHLRSVVAESGLALLLHVPHLFAVPALDGLLLRSGASCWFVEELSFAIRMSSSLKPGSVDKFEFIIVQTLEVDVVFVDVVHRVFGDLGDGLDH